MQSTIPSSASARAILDHLLAGRKLILSFPDEESVRRFFAYLSALKSKVVTQATEVGLDFDATRIRHTETLLGDIADGSIQVAVWLEPPEKTLFTILSIE